MCRNHINALYGLWRVPQLNKYYITLHRRVFKRLAFDLQSSSETLRLNQCVLKLAAGRTDVLSLYLKKNCCMHNFFFWTGREGAIGNERSKFRAGCWIFHYKNFNKQSTFFFFAVIATFVDSGDVRLRQTHWEYSGGKALMSFSVPKTKY